MLRELFTYLRTPAPVSIKQLGYLTETIAIRERYRRRSSAWQPHLDATRQFVLSTVEACADRKKVVILGSGLLLDVPLAELAGKFEEVILVDIICLPEVRKSIAGYSNVQFVESDITGVAQRLYENCRQRIPGLPEPVPCLPDAVHRASLVISLNILSQLWVVPRAYAVKRLLGLNVELIERWCERIVESHYAALRVLSGNVCLVADYEWRESDRTGTIISEGTSIFGLKLPKPAAVWTWHIAPLGEETRFGAKALTVGAWPFFEKKF